MSCDCSSSDSCEPSNLKNQKNFSTDLSHKKTSRPNHNSVCLSSTKCSCSKSSSNNAIAISKCSSCNATRSKCSAKSSTKSSSCKSTPNLTYNQKVSSGSSKSCKTSTSEDISFHLSQLNICEVDLNRSSESVTNFCLCYIEK